VAEIFDPNSEEAGVAPPRVAAEGCAGVAADAPAGLPPNSDVNPPVPEAGPPNNDADFEGASPRSAVSAAPKPPNPPRVSPPDGAVALVFVAAGELLGPETLGLRGGVEAGPPSAPAAPAADGTGPYFLISLSSISRSLPAYFSSSLATSASLSGMYAAYTSRICRASSAASSATPAAGAPVVVAADPEARAETGDARDGGSVDSPAPARNVLLGLFLSSGASLRAGKAAEHRKSRKGTCTSVRHWLPRALEGKRKKGE
jgi:hypothetical protein